MYHNRFYKSLWIPPLYNAIRCIRVIRIPIRCIPEPALRVELYWLAKTVRKLRTFIERGCIVVILLYMLVQRLVIPRYLYIPSVERCLLGLGNGGSVRSESDPLGELKLRERIRRSCSLLSSGLICLTFCIDHRKYF